jgi:hypothetical protein
MARKCDVCFGSLGKYIFYCPKCLVPVLANLPKWNDFFAQSKYEAEGREMEQIRQQRELEAANFDLLREQWLEWRAMSKSEQRDFWLSTRVRPLPQQYGVSAKGAEALTADWLKYLGEESVLVTDFAKDGGVDVLTSVFCCQVKNYEIQPVTVNEAREIFGVAQAQEKASMIFTSSALSTDAFEFCKVNSIVVIQFDAFEAELKALTPYSTHFLSAGEYQDSQNPNNSES